MAAFARRLEFREHLVDLLRLLAVGRHQSLEPLVERDRAVEVVALRRGRGGHGDGLRIVGLERQRALQQFGGTSGEPLALRHRDGLGLVGEQARVFRHALGGFREGRHANRRSGRA